MNNNNGTYTCTFVLCETKTSVQHNFSPVVQNFCMLTFMDYTDFVQYFDKPSFVGWYFDTVDLSSDHKIANNTPSHRDKLCWPLIWKLCSF